MTILKFSRSPKAFEDMFVNPRLMNKEMKQNICSCSSCLPLATGDRATAAQITANLRHTLGIDSVYVKSVGYTKLYSKVRELAARRENGK
jgi:hypothetical protein